MTKKINEKEENSINFLTQQLNEKKLKYNSINIPLKKKKKLIMEMISKIILF